MPTTELQATTARDPHPHREPASSPPVPSRAGLVALAATVVATSIVVWFADVSSVWLVVVSSVAVCGYFALLGRQLVRERTLRERAALHEEPPPDAAGTSGVPAAGAGGAETHPERD